MPKESDLISRSHLPVWIIQSLLSAGLSRLSKIAEMSDKDLLLISGVGQRSRTLIRAEIERAGRHSSNNHPQG
ncbi:helix-hairpin-helix domain-containing protein [Agrobacterium vitis]|uniref:helix-hairpin-helix domain-containing protein n=1 Tax=Agrobacterium vitis TaxID=373 RepID=UPI0012E98DEA|nr:helix-hairpin-helix domain-containing protein [Agrobacterium vitis]MVA38045.1 helix-hairpin-helix domain-containing protein [Agrobacterium vitis]MVA82518.1 helix-hairpin-helix domain-containing protein [Agrobacterium vitis]